MVAAMQQTTNEPPLSGGTLSDAAKSLAERLTAALADSDREALSAEALQALFAVLVRTYAARVEEGERLPVFSGNEPVAATDIMITASALLAAGGLQVFELGMWQSYSNIR